MATVSVACKLPNGLTVAHAPKNAKGEAIGPTQTVTFAGSNAPGAVMGYGLTRDVDGEWFANWTKTDGKDFPAVRNMAIFAQASTDEATDAAKEMSGDVKTGLEALDPQKPGAGVEPVTA